MIVHIHVDSMKAAEQLAGICKGYACEMCLRSEKYCVDPKSTLGILAMMYSSRDQMLLDTGSMPDKDVPAFLNTIASYVITED